MNDLFLNFRNKYEINHNEKDWLKQNLAINLWISSSIKNLVSQFSIDSRNRNGFCKINQFFSNINRKKKDFIQIVDISCRIYMDTEYRFIKYISIDSLWVFRSFTSHRKLSITIEMYFLFTEISWQMTCFLLLWINHIIMRKWKRPHIISIHSQIQQIHTLHSVT